MNALGRWVYRTLMPEQDERFDEAGVEYPIYVLVAWINAGTNEC